MQPNSSRSRDINQMVSIITERFFLRELSPDDATETYLAWLKNDESSRYISVRCDSISSLRHYIANKCCRDDVLFLGIFNILTAEHIGNIKYEPIDVWRGCATMGLLIGEPAWRCRGAAKEVITASSLWLMNNRGVREIKLGVDRGHEQAIRAYKKAGFELSDELSYTDQFRAVMCLRMPK